MRILLPLMIALAIFAQDPPAGAPSPQKKARPAPKNLKLLTPEELMPKMHEFTTSLGTQCTGCHVQGDFASDENPKKEVARTMISMVRDINAKYLAGKTQATCYTCHRGAEEPKTAPEPKAP